MKKNVLKSTLQPPFVSELPEKIPLTFGKNLREAETRLEQIYPKANAQTMVIPYQRTVKLTVEIPASLSKILKIKCLDRGITLKQYVIDRLEQSLE